MDEARSWTIYGAYGYSGELIAREAVAGGLAPVLAGRRPEPLFALADELGLDARPFQLESGRILDQWFGETDLVLHCAGPFRSTFRAVSEACLRSGSHYLDITGEVDVLESLGRRDAQAREAGVVVMGGVGFDVVPTDCMALHLTETFRSRHGRDPERLLLAFAGLDRMSHGTAVTAVESLGGGGRARIDGRLETVPWLWKAREIDFGDGDTTCVTIPWGDLATAHRSTGIDDIEVYAPAGARRRLGLRAMGLLEPLLALRPVRAFLRSRVAPGGPDDAQRSAARGTVWGRVEGGGDAVEARLSTPDGYTLTATAAVECARRVMAGEVEPGSHTPAQAFGADFVTGLEGVGDFEEIDPPSA